MLISTPDSGARNRKNCGLNFQLKKKFFKGISKFDTNLIKVADLNKVFLLVMSTLIPNFDSSDTEIHKTKPGPGSFYYVYSYKKLWSYPVVI